jgi:DHA2 family multidrug resistance protein
MSGWLAEIIGRKQYFMLSLAIFTISSLLCGLAPSLPVLLFFRALQGIGGGGLQPMAQAILNDSFPPEKRGVAFALYGISAVLAPTVGPMLGGWITGYTAGLAGLVLSGGGVVLLVMMPITGRLTSKIQARYLIATGWLCLAVGLIYSAHQIDLFVSFRFAMWLRITQVVGVGFLFVPITAAGYIGVPPEKGNSVSGIINFMRNIGGSIGTSLVTTLIIRRSQYHQQILVGHITPDTPAYRSALRGLSSDIAHSGLRATDAHNQAIARFYGLVNQQAHALSYMDTFWILGAFCSLMFILAFFLKKNDPGAGGAVAAG